MKITDNFARLALGTAQFGLDYGIANQQGRVSSYEIGRILEQALIAGITTLDTAIIYGESESALGRHDLQNFSVVTKLPELPADCSDIDGWIESQLLGSLTRLGLGSVDGLLLHRPAQLLESRGKDIYSALLKLRDQRLVHRIGVSIYDPTELHPLCERYHFDLLQAPFNVLDMRLLTSGWLDRLASCGTAIHIRSIFLQGLLLLSGSSRPDKFARWSSVWTRWDKWLADTNQTPLQACLRHALSFSQIERFVVGVDNLAQLREIIQAADGEAIPFPAGINCTDVELLNPSLWNRL